MDSQRPAGSARPATTVFTNVWDLMSAFATRHDIVGASLPRAPVPSDPPLRGVLAIVEDSQCEPVSEIDITEPPPASRNR
jgi:hypothetical protein